MRVYPLPIHLFENARPNDPNIVFLFGVGEW